MNDFRNCILITQYGLGEPCTLLGPHGEDKPRLASFLFFRQKEQPPRNFLGAVNFRELIPCKH